MSSLQFSERVLNLAREAQTDIQGQFAAIDEIAEYNSQKVLAAFQNNRVAEAYFAGTTGYLVFDDLINPTCLRICRKRHIIEREIPIPQQITGFEYQFQACADAISAGRLEPESMPHAETLYIMHLMDRLRTEWGVPTSSVVK